MKKIFATFLLSIVATSAFSQGISLSSGVLDYSDDNKRAGFLEATVNFIIKSYCNTSHFINTTGRVR